MMAKAEFNGEVYLHPMIAERQREVCVSITALQMMQKHHNNEYFSFDCVRQCEENEWYVKAEQIVPHIKMVGE
jgi:hypothetical protein